MFEGTDLFHQQGWSAAEYTGRADAKWEDRSPWNRQARRSQSATCLEQERAGPTTSTGTALPLRPR